MPDLRCMIVAAFLRLSRIWSLVKSPASFKMPGTSLSHSPKLKSDLFTGFGLPPIFSELEGILLGPVSVDGIVEEPGSGDVVSAYDLVRMLFFLSSFTIGIVDILLDVGVGQDVFTVHGGDIDVDEDILVSEEEENEIHVSPLADEDCILVED